MAMAVDGTATGQGSGGAALNATLTTTHANDIIVVVVTAENRPSNTVPTVNSVTASGLTFTRRSTTASSFDVVEIWWAFATSAFSAKTISSSVFGYDDADIIAFGVSGSDFTGSGNPWNQGGGASINNSSEQATLSTDAFQLAPFVIAIYSDSSAVVPSGTLQPAYMSNLTNVDNNGGGDWEYTHIATGVASGSLAAVSVGWTGTTSSPNPLVVVDAITFVAAQSPPLVSGWGPFSQPGVGPGLTRFGRPRAVALDGAPGISIKAVAAFGQVFAQPEANYSYYATSAYGSGTSVHRDPVQVPGVSAFGSGFGMSLPFTVRAVSAFGSGFVGPSTVPSLTVMAYSAYGSGWSFPTTKQNPLGPSVVAFAQGYSAPALLLMSIPGTTTGGGGTTVQNPGGVVSANWRWQLIDPTGVLSPYLWEINPNQANLPSLQKQITKTPTTAEDGPMVLFEGRQQVATATVQGTFLTHDQFVQLLIWFNLRRPFYLLDDLAVRYTVYITEFDVGRRLSKQYPWKSDYTLNWIVCDTLYPGSPGPGFSRAGGV